MAPGDDRACPCNINQQIHGLRKHKVLFRTVEETKSRGARKAGQDSAVPFQPSSELWSSKCLTSSKNLRTLGPELNLKCRASDYKLIKGCCHSRSMQRMRVRIRRWMNRMKERPAKKQEVDSGKETSSLKRQKKKVCDPISEKGRSP